MADLYCEKPGSTRKHRTQENKDSCQYCKRANKIKQKQRNKDLHVITNQSAYNQKANSEIEELENKYFIDDPQEFDPFAYNIKDILNEDHGNWKPREIEGLEKFKEVLAYVDDLDDPNSDDMRSLKTMIEQLPGPMRKPEFNRYPRTPVKDERLYYMQKYAEDVYTQLLESERIEEVAEQREPNNHLIGLDKSRKQIMQDQNISWGDNNSIYGNVTDEDLNYAINQQIKFGDMEPLGDHSDTKSLMLKQNRLRSHLSTNNKLYLAMVWPEKELKESMDKAGVTNVSVSTLENTREWGNIYTVMQPDGSTRSFTVYEHRNSDSIIINGKENWNGEDLPYAGETKNDFYAEFSYHDRAKAAETLTFFMKEAQNGELKDDAWLVNNAPKLDWRAILSKQLGKPFDDWYEKQVPRKTPVGNSEEEILQRLDFDTY